MASAGTRGFAGGGSASLSGASVGARGGFDVGLNRSFSVGRRGGELDPRDIPGLQVWYDAATATVVAGVVSSWTDLSGNGNHAIQGTPTQRPSYGLTSQNGFPVITNDGVDDTLTITSPVVLTNWDIIVVGKVPGGLNTPVIIGHGGTNTQAARLDGSANTMRCFDTSQSGTSATTTPVVASFSVFEWCRTGVSTDGFFQNGTPLANTPGGGSPALNITVNVLFNLGGTPQPLSNVLGILIYNRQLASNERSLIVSYLRERFSI